MAARFDLVPKLESGSIDHTFVNAFQTRRLLLRPIGMADAQPIYDGCARDPEVSRYVTWKPHASLEQTEAYVATWLKATTYRTYALLRRTDNAVIGAFDLRQYGPTRLGFGYVLARAGFYDASAGGSRGVGTSGNRQFGASAICAMSRTWAPHA